MALPAVASEIAVDIGTENSKAARDRKVLVDTRLPPDPSTGQHPPLMIPSYSAYNRITNKIAYIGDKAKSGYGRFSDTSRFEILRFMADGEIEKTKLAEDFLTVLIKEHLQPANLKGRLRARLYPNCIIAVPPRANGPQRLAFKRCLAKTTGGKVTVVSQTIAAAVGAHAQLEDSAAMMIVEIGGGSSDVEAISQNSSVARNTTRAGGDKITYAIQKHLQSHHNILVDFMTAEEIKLAVASALPSEELSEVPQPYLVIGMDPATNISKTLMISCDDLFPAVDRVVQEIEVGIKEALDQMTRRVRIDLQQREAILAGGTALLRGLSPRLKKTFNFPFIIAKNAPTAVIEGLVALQGDNEYLELVKELEGDDGI